MCIGEQDMEADLIVRGDVIITMNHNRQIIYQGALAVRGGILVAVDTAENIMRSYDAKSLIDVGSDILLPGFINAHTHSPMVLLRGCADDVSLKSWLKNKVFPLEKELLNESWTYHGSFLAIIEMMRGGTTTMVDMYWYLDGIVRACEDTGMRAIIGSTVLHHEHEVEQAKNFVERWRDHALVTCAVAPHSVSQVPLDLLHQAYAVARDYSVPFLIHVGETLDEEKAVYERYGHKSIALLEREQLLSDRCILAHMVHCLPPDFDIVAECGAGIAHCPTSNMKLASGVALITSMFERGCKVGLGTDGAASNNALDMVAEMKQMVLLQRVHTMRADALSATDALEIATIRGAQAIHKEHEIGSLEIGKKADIISIASHGWHQIPDYDPISTIVYASNRSDVRTVIIGGDLKVRDGVVRLPQERIEEVKRYAEEMKLQVKELKSRIKS
jgi:5-methylthioadenosine/S-adenosylhomocysteine deaminase